MDLEKEFNSLIPNEFGGEMNEELLQGCIEICTRHDELNGLLAIQEYLLEHGANDETINDKILKGLKS